MVLNDKQSVTMGIIVHQREVIANKLRVQNNLFQKNIGNVPIRCQFSSSASPRHKNDFGFLVFKFQHKITQEPPPYALFQPKTNAQMALVGANDFFCHSHADTLRYVSVKVISSKLKARLPIFWRKFRTCGRPIWSYFS